MKKTYYLRNKNADEVSQIILQSSEIGNLENTSNSHLSAIITQYFKAIRTATFASDWV